MDEKKTYEYKGTVTIGTDEYRDLVSECATCKVTSDEYRSRLWSEQATVLTLKNELKELKSEAEKLRTFSNSDREHRLAYRQFIAEVEDNKDA